MKLIKKIIGWLVGIYCSKCGMKMKSYGWYEEKSRCPVCK